MYFDLVLIYPALRFINDISLMNFSALTSRRPLYVAMYSSLILQVFFFLNPFRSFHCFSLVILKRLRRLSVSRFCWDCKGRNLFVFVKLFIFYFSGVVKLFKTQTNLNRFLFLHVFQNLFFHPSHCFPSSEAGCKSRKKYHHTKQLYQLICIKGLITCFSGEKTS